MLVIVFCFVSRTCAISKKQKKIAKQTLNTLDSKFILKVEHIYLKKCSKAQSEFK